MRERIVVWLALLFLAIIPWLWVGRTATSATMEGSAAPDRQAPPAASISAVRRICVEDFEGGENARQLRAMVIDELRRIGRFVITENPKAADAYLRGFAEDLVYTEQYSRNEAVSTRGTGSLSRGGLSRDRRAISGSIGANESLRDRSVVRRHEASLTVRLVNTEGDVLWSAMAESRGGKFRSASAEVAAKVAETLREELERVQARPGQ